MERNYSMLNPDNQNINQTNIISNSNIFHDAHQDENIQHKNTIHSYDQIQKEPNLFSVQRKALSQVSKFGNENYANFEEKPNVEKDFCEI